MIQKRKLAGKAIRNVFSSSSTLYINAWGTHSSPRFPNLIKTLPNLRFLCVHCYKCEADLTVLVLISTISGVLALCANLQSHSACSVQFIKQYISLSEPPNLPSPLLPLLNCATGIPWALGFEKSLCHFWKETSNPKLHSGYPDNPEKLGNMRHSDQGNDEHHIHLPHLRMPHSLHFPSRHHHKDGHGGSKEEAHHHDGGHHNSKEEAHRHDGGHGSSKEEAHDFHKDVPKGCVAIYVGSEGEEHERFVVPAVHINHPLFQKLLKEAEKEYGFEQKGAITIPCHVSEFQNVEDLINKEHDRHSQSSSFCFP